MMLLSHYRRRILYVNLLQQWDDHTCHDFPMRLKDRMAVPTEFSRHFLTLTKIPTIMPFSLSGIV